MLQLQPSRAPPELTHRMLSASFFYADAAAAIIASQSFLRSL